MTPRTRERACRDARPLRKRPLKPPPNTSQSWVPPTRRPPQVRVPHCAPCRRNARRNSGNAEPTRIGPRGRLTNRDAGNALGGLPSCWPRELAGLHQTQGAGGSARQRLLGGRRPRSVSRHRYHSSQFHTRVSLRTFLRKGRGQHLSFRQNRFPAAS